MFWQGNKTLKLVSVKKKINKKTAYVLHKTTPASAAHESIRSQPSLSPLQNFLRRGEGEQTRGAQVSEQEAVSSDDQRRNNQ